MPLTFSIANAIGFGFISYLVIKLLTGRIKDLNAGVVFIALLFLVKFIYG
jgi:AGZA family xanthine/uracil permease-like MFS transporter